MILDEVAHEVLARSSSAECQSDCGTSSMCFVEFVMVLQCWEATLGRRIVISVSIRQGVLTVTSG